MRTAIVGFLLSIALLSSTSSGECQIRAKSYQLSPAFGVLWTDVSKEGFDLDSRSALLGMNGSWNVTDRIAAEGSFHWSPTRNQDPLAPRELNLGLFDGGVVAHLTKSHFVPYARGGIGYIKNFSEIADEGPSDVFYTFGGGIKVMAS